MTRRDDPIVYLPGVRWSDVAGTDHRLVTALSETAPVLWVDPPFSLATASPDAGSLLSGLSDVGPDIVRLQTRTIPGPSRSALRPVADAMIAASIRRAVSELDLDVGAVVVASSRAAFPAGVAGTRVLHVTDDWVAGARMMGSSSSTIARTLEQNAMRADVVTAVTPYLAGLLEARFPSAAAVRVLPNGCEPPSGIRSTPSPVAGLVGQLNERLDFDVLEAILARGIRILVIGPRTERTPQATRRLDRFLGAEQVSWLGALPHWELAAHLATMGVGLTPYAENEFNRSSFPLKILEYLAAGLAVVSTDLPAVTWLDTDLIDVAADPADFAGRVESVLAEPLTGEPAEARRLQREAFARGHSWKSVAAQLRGILADSVPASEVDSG